MNKKKICLIAAALVLAGCETTGPLKQAPQASAPQKEPAPVAAAPATPPAPPAPPELPPARKALNAGIEMYRAGNFNGAIKQLTTAPELAKAETPLQLEALKYTAFSYCVTNRVTLCRQQFDKAFKLDKTFDLNAGEKGHPLWTPSFERARKDAKIKK
ncbi:TssQ family T6SS-associated lipoprotein [Pseudoduganella sp. OTU4001]|uniref:TssQ family T6SS-associated lipoprotein n=1 Tax=Pseudoduganella sp. OTU4001 TaxID=3043854 RepID=UPI00313DC418